MQYTHLTSRLLAASLVLSSLVGCKPKGHDSDSAVKGADSGDTTAAGVSPQAQNGYNHSINLVDTAGRSLDLNDSQAPAPAGSGQAFASFPGNNGTVQPVPGQPSWQQQQVGYNLWNTTSPAGKTLHWRRADGSDRFSLISTQDFYSDDPKLALRHWPACTIPGAATGSVAEPGTDEFRQTLRAQISAAANSGKVSAMNVASWDNDFGHDRVQAAMTALIAESPSFESVLAPFLVK